MKNLQAILVLILFLPHYVEKDIQALLVYMETIAQLLDMVL